jgi:hypothetical protein
MRKLAQRGPIAKAASRLLPAAALAGLWFG